MGGGISHVDVTESKHSKQTPSCPHSLHMPIHTSLFFLVLPQRGQSGQCITLCSFGGIPNGKLGGGGGMHLKTNMCNQLIFWGGVKRGGRGLFQNCPNFQGSQFETGFCNGAMSEVLFTGARSPPPPPPPPPHQMVRKHGIHQGRGGMHIDLLTHPSLHSREYNPRSICKARQGIAPTMVLDEGVTPCARSSRASMLPLPHTPNPTTNVLKLFSL